MSIETTIQHGRRRSLALSGNCREPSLRLVPRDPQAHRAENELNDLSDRYLRDIGVDRPQIAELVKREIARDYAAAGRVGRAGPTLLTTTLPEPDHFGLWSSV